MVRIYIILILFFSALGLNARATTPFVKASTSKQQVFVEQAFKLTLTVYTNTWFTKPIQIENLQVDGAFVQSFKQTQSGIKYIDKKKFVTLEFYYIVFPYQAGTITIPELNIDVESPPEGEYKGVLTSIKSQALKVNIEGVPGNADQSDWLVATNANINNNWSLDLKQLKVGDVLTRTVTTVANGTLPSFIDEAKVAEVEFAKIYSSSPKFTDLRDTKSVNGKRTDTYSYLIEKDGKYTIPEIELSWYNPYLGKSYKRILPAYEVEIAPNPELASLQALSDSLNTLNPILVSDETSSEKGMNSRLLITAILVFVLLVVAVLFIVRQIKRLNKKSKERINTYKNSELYWYRKLKKTTNDKELLVRTYQWLDNSQKLFHFNQISKIELSESANIEVQQLKANIYANSADREISLKKILSAFSKWRKNKLKRKNRSHKNRITNDINA